LPAGIGAFAVCIKIEISLAIDNSCAGHDAAVFANAGVPSAMIFVRNEHGSHNPHQAMAIEDFLTGVAVMRAALKEAANQ
jgi:acetylornithine deacetylase/succinyl-diaminopimelate desuccinylase-like protein